MLESMILFNSSTLVDFVKKQSKRKNFENNLKEYTFNPELFVAILNIFYRKRFEELDKRKCSVWGVIKHSEYFINDDICKECSKKIENELSEDLDLKLNAEKQVEKVKKIKELRIYLKYLGIKI